MDNEKKNNRIIRIAIKVAAVTALIVYGGCSIYMLYLIIPEKITDNLLVELVFGTGGSLAAFVPLGLYLNIAAHEDKKSPRYLYTVFLSLFSIPIMIYGAYLIKLQNIGSYKIDSDRIRYKLSTDYTVNGVAPEKDTWEIYYTDNSDREINDTKILEMGKYDIVTYHVNIKCNEHSIEDRKYPLANLNDHTVWRIAAFYFGDRDAFSRAVSGNVVVYNENGNEYAIKFTTKTERVLSVWEVLLAGKTTSEDSLEKIDMLGADCSNLVRDYWDYNGEFQVEENVLVEAYDDRRLLLFDDYLDRNVIIESFADDSGYYEAVNTYTLEPMSISEAGEYYNRILKLAREAYGVSHDDVEDDYGWMHRTDDILCMLTIEEDEEEEGYYGVSFLVADRVDAERRFNEFAEQQE
ncbi:MAG: hypothetical protein K6D90_06070 [Lachnospiraceae bacterium]|nr:hypothetical protein [Lachnospiraceae bacterium]